jgi:large subunit ribosomal protein L9
MQVILMERIEKLGLMGEVVTVKPGYARNYLLPQGKARRATKDNIAEFEQQRGQLEAENLERRDEAEKVGARLEGLMVTLIRQAGESGQLYGSVNARNLAESVTEAGFTIAHDQVSRDHSIKTLGLHPVQIRLHPEVSATITANVARSEAEAETQAGTGRVVSEDEQREVEEAAQADTEAALAEIETEEAEAAAREPAEDANTEDAKTEDAKTEDADTEDGTTAKEKTKDA